MGIQENGRIRHGLAREQLEPLIEADATLREMAVELNRSVSTIQHWLRKHGLRTTRARGALRVSPEAVEQAVRDGSRTVLGRCRRHGETEFAIVGSAKRPRCKHCRAEAVARRRRKVKKILVEEAGGQCVLCGYSKSIAALEFHHQDPESKSFGLAQRGITRSIAEVRREAQKCVLVCANCHAELEFGDASLPVELTEAIVSGQAHSDYTIE